MILAKPHLQPSVLLKRKTKEHMFSPLPSDGAYTEFYTLWAKNSRGVLTTVILPKYLLASTDKLAEIRSKPYPTILSSHNSRGVGENLACVTHFVAHSEKADTSDSLRIVSLVPVTYIMDTTKFATEEEAYSTASYLSQIYEVEFLGSETILKRMEEAADGGDRR